MNENPELTNVVDAPAEIPAKASVGLRVELARRIEAILTEAGWSQAESARRCKVSPYRVGELMHGRVSRISLDALVNMAEALGRRVQMKVEATGEEG